MIHVGIVGYGKMGKIHANTVRSNPACKLDWIADPNPHADADYRVPAMAPGVDVVIIASPTPAHAAQTVGFSATGAVVLVEKPMCLSAESAQYIVESGAPVFVSQPVRYAKKELVEYGELKRYAKYRGQSTNYKDAAWDLAIHDIDWLVWKGLEDPTYEHSFLSEWDKDMNCHQIRLRHHDLLFAYDETPRLPDGETHDGTEIQRQFADVVHFMTKGSVPERLCTAEQAKPVIDLLARITK